VGDPRGERHVAHRPALAVMLFSSVGSLLNVAPFIVLT
jgi:hypothetical protein